MQSHRRHGRRTRRVKLGLDDGLWVLIWSHRVDRAVPAGGVITELGPSGARVDVGVPFAVASPLELCFVLPGMQREIVCGAVVRALTPSGRMDLDFTLLECADRDAVARWATDARRLQPQRTRRRA